MQLRTYPDPVLRRVATNVDALTVQLHHDIDLMIQAMLKHDGIGLAANQLGFPYNAFVARLGVPPQTIVFINPVLIDQQPPARSFEEGCLSCPGITQTVYRPEHVVIEATNFSGVRLRYTLEGLAARVVQHEMDHLKGQLIIDYIQEFKKVWWGEPFILPRGKDDRPISK